MQTVEQIARQIVGREGGFVDDPDDPGGATNHGVTLHTLRRLGLDLTGDGEVSWQTALTNDGGPDKVGALALDPHGYIHVAGRVTIAGELFAYARKMTP